MASSANTTFFVTWPVAGLNTSPLRAAEETGLPPIQTGTVSQLQFSGLVHAVARFPPLSLAIAAFTRGITCSAMSCIERFSSLGSTQSMPA